MSDAGTPLISDPGYHLVNDCRAAGINVVPLPGPCAAITALSASGLPSDRFSFEGFLPAKDKAKTDVLTALLEEPRTMIFYESPHKLIKTLEQFVLFFGADRQISVSRELTKLHEETLRGSGQEILAHFSKNNPKGEFVLVVAGFSGKKNQ